MPGSHRTERNARKSKNLLESWLYSVWAKPSSKLCFIFWSVVSLLLYANTLSNDYALDDVNIIRNQQVQKGIAGIPALFTQASLPSGVEGYQAPYYRPFTLATFALEANLGRRAAPTLSHGTNIFLYGCILFFAYALLAEYFFPHRPIIAFIAIVLFALHPIHTEVVANLKSRDELLSLLGGILFLWSIFRSLSKDSTGSTIFYQSTALLALTGALLSKENAIYFPFLLPLSLYFFSPLSFKKIIKLSTPWLALVGIYLALRAALLGIYPPILASNPLFDRFHAVSIEIEYATLLYFFAKYWIMIIFPYPLCADYSYYHFSHFNFQNFQVWLSVLLLSMGFLYSLVQFKDRSPIAFGLIWFNFTLLLVSNWIIDMGGAVAERFLFLPSLGACVALANSLWHGYQWCRLQKLTYLSPIIWGISIFAVGLDIRLVWARNKEWKNNNTLFLADVQKSPNNVHLNHAAGATYLMFAKRQSLPLPKRNLYLDSAAYFLQRALVLYPNYAKAHCDLGRVYFQKQEWHNAEKELTHALNLDSTLHLAWFNLGSLYAQNKNYSKAIYALQKAVSLQPNALNYRYNLGLTYLRANELLEAEKNFEYIIKVNPFYPQAQAAYLKTVLTLADTLIAKAEYLQAKQYLQKAIRMQPMAIELKFKLAKVATQNQEYELARAVYESILQVVPQNSQALQELAKLRK
ncbi:MAG: tetratricopeptide repeat protein [Bacteroidia bacterium]|nr:tetratricopeptide repeat protein [Bacteroidia bacterium]MDW8159796.1 tetratricopeptide repeat protein [Bacteroidia bacterium]